MFEQTEEDIERHYSACLDSVSLINTLVAKPSLSEEELDTVKRNVEHLDLMVGRDFWTTEDLGPLNAAIELGKEKTNI